MSHNQGKPGLQAGQHNSQKIRHCSKKMVTSFQPGAKCLHSRSASHMCLILSANIRAFSESARGRPRDYEALGRPLQELRHFFADAFNSHLSFLSSRPCFSVSLNLVMTSGASSAVVAIVMLSTHTHYSSSIVCPTLCFCVSCSALSVCVRSPLSVFVSALSLCLCPRAICVCVRTCVCRALCVFVRPFVQCVCVCPRVHSVHVCVCSRLLYVCGFERPIDVGCSCGR